MGFDGQSWSFMQYRKTDCILTNTRSLTSAKAPNNYQICNNKKLAYRVVHQYYVGYFPYAKVLSPQIIYSGTRNKWVSKWLYTFQATVLNLGSRTQRVLSLTKTFIDKTDVTFDANKKRIICTGRMENGSPTANVCGQNGLPEYGKISNDMAITKVGTPV